jgi:hypothetical protein
MQLAQEMHQALGGLLANFRIFTSNQWAARIITVQSKLAA